MEPRVHDCKASEVRFYLETCGHTFCKACLVRSTNNFTADNVRCPTCGTVAKTQSLMQLFKEKDIKTFKEEVTGEIASHMFETINRKFEELKAVVKEMPNVLPEIVTVVAEELDSKKATLLDSVKDLLKEVDEFDLDTVDAYTQKFHAWLPKLVDLISTEVNGISSTVAEKLQREKRKNNYHISATADEQSICWFELLCGAGLFGVGLLSLAKISYYTASLSSIYYKAVHEKNA